MNPTKLVAFPAEAAEALLNSPNFGFLAHHHPLLVCYASLAERYVFDDPNTALIKLRQFAELLAEKAAAYHHIPSPIDGKLAGILDRLRELHVVDRHILDLFHGLRKAGNAAAHEHKGNSSEALVQLHKAYDLGVWFHRLFGKDPSFKPAPFHRPPGPIRAGRELMLQVDRLRQLEQDLEEQRRQRQRLEKELRQREAQVKELEGKQVRIEMERQSLILQRDQLPDKPHQGADKAQAQDAVRTEIEDKLTVKLKELEDNHSRLEENRQQLVRYREQLIVFQQQVEKDKAQLQTELRTRTAQLSQLEQANQQLRRRLQEAECQPVKGNKEQRGTQRPRVAAIVFGAIVLLSLCVMAIGWSRTENRSSEEAPAAARKSDSPPAFASQPHGKVEQTKSSTPTGQPKTVQPSEKEPIGPPATERQMNYLNILVQRKHWSEEERDAEIIKALGYVRSYSKLTKQEASRLIDAWKESK